MSFSFTEESMECSSSRNCDETSKKNKKQQHAYSFASDIAHLKQLTEKRANNKKKFAWLGSVVTNQMDDIDAEYQQSACWEVQCIMNKYVQKSILNKKKEEAKQTPNVAPLDIVTPPECVEQLTEFVDDNYEMLIEELEEDE